MAKPGNYNSWFERKVEKVNCSNMGENGLQGEDKVRRNSFQVEDKVKEKLEILKERVGTAVTSTYHGAPTPWAKHHAEHHRDGKVEMTTQVRFVARDPVELSIAEALLISRAVGRERDNGSVTDEARKVPRELLNKRDELSASMSLL
ncbi:hypothetical protein ACOME3_009873 [Neoechinorhynchus agilis]